LFIYTKTHRQIAVIEISKKKIDRVIIESQTEEKNNRTERLYNIWKKI